MLHLAPEMRCDGGDCGVMLSLSRRCLDEQILAEIDFDEDAVVSAQMMRVQDCDRHASARVSNSVLECVHIEGLGGDTKISWGRKRGMTDPLQPSSSSQFNRHG